MGIVPAIVIVLVLAGAAAYFRWQDPGLLGRLFSKEPNPRRLRHKYGPEYDRLYAEHGDHAAVAQELGRRESERAGLSITPVDGPQRTRLTAEWTNAQAAFLDDPGRAARRAEQLVGEVLTLRGYPAGDPLRQLALASVDHPRTLSAFRDGHDLLQRSNTGAPGIDATEQLRQAMLNFRAFFDDLVGPDAGTRTPDQAAIADSAKKVPA
jgi:hypothetical protein